MNLIACIGPKIPLPVRGSLLTRAAFHNLPVPLVGYILSISIPIQYEMSYLILLVKLL